MLIFWILLFLLLSALFSGTEIAFVSANKLRIELKKKKNASRGRILSEFYERPSAFLGTMLVGNNIVLVIFTYLMTRALSPYIEPFLQGDLLLLLVNTVLITIVVLIFGEFLPKTIFRLYADDILYFLAYPIKLFQLLLAAPAWVVTRLSEALLRLFVRSPIEASEQAFSRVDLEHFVNSSPPDTQSGSFDRKLFGKALNLKDTRVRDCMIPRPEIESIDLNAPLSALEELFRQTKLSRIIVVEDEVDNVLGYVHHQQLLRQPKTIKNILMEIRFVPEVMRITDLLNRFIQERVNIACVVDEFGGVAGLITMEDILEELFGEIEDEHDEEEYIETQISDDEYVFSGRLEIDYLNEKYPALYLPEGDYHTLSGYLVMTTETIPEAGAEIILGDYKFILEAVSETKIETVRVLRQKSDD
ncbi:MAG TPA: hemolysin family protein [Saprospiraceae bacterium]|nr:hemolysin family protein [Saprospiraceae bacterium]HMP23786.1 hemolysin family protein [Saprospiraceae bacterium]